MMVAYSVSTQRAYASRASSDDGKYAGKWSCYFFECA